MTDEEIIQKARREFVDAETDEFYIELTSKKLRTEWIKGVVDTLWDESSRNLFRDSKELKELRELKKKAVESLLPAVTKRAERSDRLYKEGKL